MRHIAAITMFLMVLSIGGAAQEQDKQEAATAAQSWLSLLDKGDFDVSWDQASTVFKAAISKQQWQRALGASRGQFGNLQSRKLKSATFRTTLPGAPDGKYVVIQYETSFESKKEAVETVTPMLDKDKQWHVSGYYIR